MAQLKYSEGHGIDFCLYNMPPLLYFPQPLCGNGLIDTGEQCDCGAAPSSECNANCCNNVTCQLTSGKACASGKCCNIGSCQVGCFV